MNCSQDERNEIVSEVFGRDNGLIYSKSVSDFDREWKQFSDRHKQKFNPKWLPQFHDRIRNNVVHPAVTSSVIPANWKNNNVEVFFYCHVQCVPSMTENIVTYFLREAKSSSLLILKSKYLKATETTVSTLQAVHGVIKRFQDFKPRYLHETTIITTGKVKFC